VEVYLYYAIIIQLRNYSLTEINQDLAHKSNNS
jgi:hypothetical protein